VSPFFPPPFSLLRFPVHASCGSRRMAFWYDSTWSFRKASGEVDGRELPLLARVRLGSRVAPPWAR
jgi:hypothetical protein